MTSVNAVMRYHRGQQYFSMMQMQREFERRVEDELPAVTRKVVSMISFLRLFISSAPLGGFEAMEDH